MSAILRFSVVSALAAVSAAACAGRASAYVVTGVGWDGAGQGSAVLHYWFDKYSKDLPEADQATEVKRALREWTKYVDITWVEATGPDQAESVDILWAKRGHGDPYPFDGRSGVLAHTFYPADINSEPIAGDMHFDEDETWSVGGAGNTIDIFSVALHELGHALGLGHSSDTSAVMYAYYQIVTELQPDDVAGVRTLYAPEPDWGVGDLDGDGFVGLGDYSIFTNLYGTAFGSPDYDWRCDIDGDLFVGLGDYSLFSDLYGTTYAYAASGGAAPEPATALVLGIGALAVAFGRWRA